MTGTIVGVLRGGPSREHEASLRTGHAIVRNLNPDRFTIKDIYIDTNGVWHDRGRPISPSLALRSIDVAVLGLHGEYGEDGEVQKVLEAHGVPYTGSDPLASFLATHKVLAKERAHEHGILTPKYRLAEAGTDLHIFAADIVRAFHQPVRVAPARSGSSLGVTLAHGYHEILAAATNLLASGTSVLVEEPITGKEAAVSLVEGLRGEALYAFPAIEGVTDRHISPGRFSKDESAELVRIARVMHESLGFRHYSHSEFMVSPRGVFYLGTTPLPRLSDGSMLRESMSAVGVSLPDLLEHFVTSALGKR